MKEQGMQIPKKKDSRKKALYKTELCLSTEEFGACPYGNKCQFAHSPSELRTLDRHPRYKTQRCNTFWENGSCPYGRRCCFIHMENPSITGVNQSQIDDDNFTRQRSHTVPNAVVSKEKSPTPGTKSLQSSPVRGDSSETMVSDLDGAFEKISLATKSNTSSPDLKIKTGRKIGKGGLSQLEIHNVFTDFGPFTAPLSPVGNFGRSATEPMSAHFFGSSFGRSFGNDQQHSPLVSSFGRSRRGFPDVWKAPVDQDLIASPFAVDSQAFGSLGSAFANINSPIFGDGDSIKNIEIESVRSRPSSPKGISNSLRNWGDDNLMDNLEFGRSLH